MGGMVLSVSGRYTWSYATLLHPDEDGSSENLEEVQKQAAPHSLNETLQTGSHHGDDSYALRVATGECISCFNCYDITSIN